MLKVRRFIEGDAYGLNIRKENSWDATKDECEHTESLAAQGIAFTFLEISARADTTPIMVMGCSLLWPGCGQVWAVPSYEARGYGLELVRAARYLLYMVAKTERIHRYQTLVHPLVPENIKWIKLLGFTAESVLRNACPLKHNVIMYRMLVEETNVEAKNAKGRLQRDVAELFNLDPRSVGTPRRSAIP